MLETACNGQNVELAIANNCPVNEEAIECEVPCQPTCEDPKRVPCLTLLCGKPDCICKKGFIRISERGPCIPIEKCQRCGRNEEPSLCSTPCQPTCANPVRFPCPTKACGDPDCVCKIGFIRLTDDGPCISGDKCRQCGLNEQIVKCDTPCQATCVEPNRRPCPTFFCGNPDCICLPGFIRSQDNGSCIPEDKCCKCGPNEKVVKCEVPCQSTCADPDRQPCPTKACGDFDCVCKDGFIRYRDNGRCVESKRCSNFMLKPSK